MSKPTPNAIPIQRADDLLIMYLIFFTIKGESFIASSVIGERKWMSRRNHQGDVMLSLEETSKEDKRKS